MIVKIPRIGCDPGSPEKLSLLMDQMDRHAIDQAPWPQYSGGASAAFSIAHTGDSLLVKYFVEEHELRLCCLQHQEPVYQDSCVEVFLAFDEDDDYYNLEFNAAGVCLAAFGRSRDDREPLPVAALQHIGSHSRIGCLREAGTTASVWELLIQIPKSVFVHHEFVSLEGMNVRGNFYKCGDALLLPHYLCWQQINSEKPNFHFPEFFGALEFANT